MDERGRENGDPDTIVLRDGIRARLKLFAVGSMLLAMSVLLVVIGETLPRVVIGWASIGMFGPLWLMSAVGLVRGGSVQIGRDSFAKVTAIRRTEYEYSRCGPFTTCRQPLPSLWRARSGPPMVVFNFDGARSALSRANRRFAGHNSFLNAGGGLSADDLAKLLNRRRQEALGS